MKNFQKIIVLGLIFSILITPAIAAWDFEINILDDAEIDIPDPIKNYLKRYASNIKHIKFSDHYNFRMKDIYTIKKEFIKLGTDNTYLITTEKDATRFQSMKSVNGLDDFSFYYLPLEFTFTGENTNFDKKILNYVKSNKTVG